MLNVTLHTWKMIIIEGGYFSSKQIFVKEKIDIPN